MHVIGITMKAVKAFQLKGKRYQYFTAYSIGLRMLNFEITTVSQLLKFDYSSP